ncbi:SNF2 domain-containing protein CLASSY 4-like [Salvia miltiorrhiza]|uniref:SNF2 domain-containing protein CLASSY 4-like n=1 Tax=Salvia miltiorrhiza TaxID=226208 RepID=UPI0025AD69E9|nr:SNF2 domain-containing protein CLASSY 4-like [Salvia miltiorrhiza]
MSDRHSMNQEEATKAFLSGVSERTRSKRDAYLGVRAQAQGIPSSSYYDSIRERKRKREMKPATSVGGRRKRSGSFIKMGMDNEDLDSEGGAIKIIDKAEYISQIPFFAPKMKSSSKEKLNRSSSSATPKKGAIKKKTPVVGHDSEHAYPHESCSFIQIESDSDETTPEDIEIQRVDKAELKSGKIYFKSKRGQSEMQGLSTARLSKKVGGACESAHHSIISLSDYSTGSDTLAEDSTSLAAEVNEDRSFRDISSKGVLKKGKTPLNRQGYSDISSKKKRADIVKKSSRDAFRGKQADRSRSSAQKVNRDENRHEQLGIEIIDEAEFRKRKRLFVSEIGSSTGQQQDEEHIAGTSTKNVRRVSKKKPSSIKNDGNKQRGKASVSALKNKGPAWHKNVVHDDDDEDSRSDESLCSSSRTESDTSPQDSEVSSYAGEQEMGVGVANRTRLKTGSIKKSSEVGSVSLGSSADSDSLTTISESDNSLDSDFEVKSSDNDIELLSIQQQACEVQPAGMANQRKVPTRAKEAAPSSHSNDSHDHSPNGNKGKIEAATTSDSHLRAKSKPADMANQRKVPTRAKEAAPSSHSNDSHDHSPNGTRGKIEAATTSDSHLRAKSKPAGMANQRKVPTRAKEAAPSSHSNDSHDHSPNGTKGIIEAATTSDSHLRAKSKPADMASENKVPTVPKKAAPPSHSKVVNDHTEENTKERAEAGTSDSRDHAQTEAADMANETEVPMRRKPVSPREDKDLCSVLADAVLGGGQLPTDSEICEEAKQAPASQTQDTLPLKFRFEDEVPKPVEKTEKEIEYDNLFCVLDREWALEGLQSYDYTEDILGKENSPPEETQHARCSRGKHELVLEDEHGLICIFCRHEELGPKDVMPEWAERTYRDSGRKKCNETEQVSFDELHLSTNDVDDAGCSSNATGTVWSIKPGVRESMYEHQREGFEFLWKNLAGSINLDELKSTDPVGVGGCIISHAPGTGKTRLTMVFVETYCKMFPDCMPVIISPASTLLNWEEEFKKWNVGFPFHNLSNLELSGKELFTPTKSMGKEVVRMVKIYSWAKGGSILGISYSLFEKLTGERNIKEKTKKNKKTEAVARNNDKIRQILLEKPGLVVLDEGHTPRNNRSNIWNALLKLQTEKRIILSGTPFQNNFGELFNTLRIVRPAIADELAQEKTYAEAVMPRRVSSSRKHKREHGQSSLISEDGLESLKARMSPFVHLHKGTILKQSLPGLRDCVILLKPLPLQKSLIKTLESSSNFKFEHEVTMISVHPYLLLKCKTTESRKSGIDMDAVKDSKLNPQAGVKTRFLMELVHLSMAVNEKVLVFSQYIQPLVLIKKQLEKVFQWTEGKEILQMRGRQTQKQRQLLKNMFNDANSESKIMLASTKCCSEGISLVGASRVVLLDVVWNPSVERQAICRAYRIGQKKFVHTYHLMTSGTSEDDKYCRQAEKERLSELVFSSSNESNQLKDTSSGIEDRILEVMIADDGLKGMFEKIINQPKETDLIQTFGLTD